MICGYEKSEFALRASEGMERMRIEQRWRLSPLLALRAGVIIGSGSKVALHSYGKLVNWSTAYR